jgi:hypothetical protein
MMMLRPSANDQRTVKHRMIGILCKLGGIGIALACLMPDARQLNLFLHWPSHDSANDMNVPTDRFKAVLVALVGLAVAYLLMRLGCHLDPRQSTTKQGQIP